MRRRVSLAWKTAGTRACARASGEAATGANESLFHSGGRSEAGDAGDAGDATKEWSSSSNTSFTGECHYSYADEASAHGGAKDGAVRADADGVVLAADGVAFDVGESGTQSHGEHVELGRVVGEWKRVE